MEYIEREAAIQAASIWNGDVSTEEWVKSALRKLPAADVIERKREWIPVTERLPEDYEPVLTCDDRGNIHMFTHCHSYKYPFNIGPYNPRFYQVMFWMELPEPPGEGE